MQLSDLDKLNSLKRDLDACDEILSRIAGMRDHKTGFNVQFLGYGRTDLFTIYQPQADQLRDLAEQMLREQRAQHKAGIEALGVTVAD
jgi:hypothetical protein